MIEFARKNSINQSTSSNPFEIVRSYQPKKPIDLIPPSLACKPSDSIESFARHIHDLHVDIRKKKKSISNKYYKSFANEHHR